MASASKTRLRRSPHHRSGLDKSPGSGSIVIEASVERPAPAGPRPVPAIATQKPAAKRHTRRVAGETPVPLPARKKYPKARTAMARPAKRMPPPPACDTEASDALAVFPAADESLWLDGTVAPPRAWHASLWQSLCGRLRAQLRRMQPRRVLLDQATARYLQLLAEVEPTRPTA